jgi:hypothetical protein
MDFNLYAKRWIKEHCCFCWEEEEEEEEDKESKGDNHFSR